MNRLKLLAAAMLLAVPIACGDPVDPPPPTGSIDGLVSVEGQGVDGISVTLSNGSSATTANGGTYRFDGVEAGAYTVTISNFPDDASFNATSAAATISTDGETVTVNFPGSWIRTSAIMGTVTVENEGLSSVTVKLSGVSNSETLTDGTGQYAFTGLRAGNYTIEISGFDDEDVAFGSTSSTATLAVGESKVVAFEGTYLRASGIMGQVTANDQPQELITVSLQGRGESRTVTTNAAGQFAFEQLRRGDYSVGISGYDADEMSFDVTSQTVTVAYGETANIPFAGTLLRTAGIQGTVAVEGVGPISDVTVTIQGEGETEIDITDHLGTYSFDGLPAGDYSVSITGFDDDEYGFPEGTSATVTIELQETGTVPFSGIMLRTAAIEGTVTVGDDDVPLPGVMVTVSGGPRDEDHSAMTDNAGMYMVEDLHAGTYSVSISGYDTDEYGFTPTTESVDVGLRETAEVAFQGDLLRTAGVSGRVHVDGMGMAGITVTLTGEESREGTTDDDGQYGFSGLAAGDYTLTITGWDEVEYHFTPTAEITLAMDESMSGVNFAGRKLRTATVMGTVTLEGDALPGIEIALLQFTGVNAVEVLGQAVTDADGDYSFGPLLAGAYVVSIVDGYEDEHAFDQMEKFVAVETDGTGTVDFAVTIIRTAGVSGMVTVDGAPMAGIEVTLAGDHAPDDNTMMTGDDGTYGFGGLRKGDYTVSIANPDATTYSFPSTSQSLNLSVGQEQDGISFAGSMLRTAGVSGQVQVDGTGLEGVTVTLGGDESRETMTDADGQYNFSALGAGDYTLTISGWDEVEYAFDPTMDVELAHNESMSGVNFVGRKLRTATVNGYVTVEDDPLPGIAVTLIRVTGGASGEVMGTTGTSTMGGYSFGPLLAGAYQVMIAGYADEHAFAATTQTTMVMTDSTATLNFAATIIRTASVSGMVTVDGDAMEGVEVTIAGDHAPDDNTMMTDADGMYSFGGLRKGDYTVSITNPDDDAYSFPGTSQALNLAVGQEQTGISFAGTRLRQASISGQVHAEGDAVEGVMVTLSGDADAEDMTDANGEYNFPGLAGGDYKVAIAGWDDAAYIFATAEADVEGLGTDEFKIVDFEGTHTRTASIGGMLFVDEASRNLDHDAGEPVLSFDSLPMGLPGFPVTLLGPDLTSLPRAGFASLDGEYSFDGLRAGAYVLNIDVEMEVDTATGHTVKDVLAYLGYEYTGPGLIQLSVDAAEDSDDNNLPFKILTQTINVGAVMGTPTMATETAVPGVDLVLFATAEHAAAGTPMLGMATTNDMGVASFDFARAMDLGPGGQGNDHLVYARVTATGDDALVFSDNRDIEIQYAAIDRVSNAHAAARLVNVQANFQWWVKSDEHARDGNAFLEGWAANHGEATDADGYSSYTAMLDLEDNVLAGDLDFEVKLLADSLQDEDATGGEQWVPSGALTHVHDPLKLPADNMAADNDLGPIYVTWTTQTLVLGFYREADDEDGFTDYQSGLYGGDHRPHDDEVPGSIRILALDGDNRYDDYEWDHDADTATDEVTASDFEMEDGLISFPGIGANDSITIRFLVGDNRKVVTSDTDGDINPWGSDLDLGSGMTVGAFGEQSGGVPEVRLCMASERDMSDDWCATYGYQWTNGSLSGAFKARRDASYDTYADTLTSAMMVDLTAETNNHGAANDDSTTMDDFSFDDLRDGTYIVSTASNDAYSVDNDSIHMFHVFYDEAAAAADEDYEGFVGDSITFNVTDQDPPATGLHIRGYVGNDANNNKRFVGGESRAGVGLSLSVWDAEDTAYVATGTTTMTDANGYYSFDDLDGRQTYRVTVNGAAGYQGLRNTGVDSIPLSNMANGLEPEEQGVPAAGIDLPRWDMQNQAAVNQDVDNGDDGAKFVNFALVYTGGISGTVNVLGGSMAGANVVAYLCTGNDAADGCADTTGTMATSANSGSDGGYTLPGLREGYYTIMLDDPTGEFAVPLVDSLGNPDDDAPRPADQTEPDTAKTALNVVLRGQDPNAAIAPLHVYRTSLSETVNVTADNIDLIVNQHGPDAAGYGAVDTIDAAGFTEANDGGNGGSATVDGGVAWSMSDVTLLITDPAVGNGTEIAFEDCSGYVCALEGDTTDATANGGDSTNVIVFMATAANGYNDTRYATAVTVAAPIGNTLSETDSFDPDAGGNATDGFTLSTAVNNTSIVVRILLDGTGAGADLTCRQSVAVTDADDDAVTPQETGGGGADGCYAEYDLEGSTAGIEYTLTVESEDKRDREQTLTITIPGS